MYVHRQEWCDVIILVCDVVAVKAVKTYIRTKSGNLIERIVFMSEEDYNKFLEGGADAEEMIKKYLSKEEAENLDSWDKEEVCT